MSLLYIALNRECGVSHNEWRVHIAVHFVVIWRWATVLSAVLATAIPTVVFFVDGVVITAAAVSTAAAAAVVVVLTAVVVRNFHGAAGLIIVGTADLIIACDDTTCTDADEADTDGIVCIVNFFDVFDVDNCVGSIAFDESVLFVGEFEKNSVVTAESVFDLNMAVDVESFLVMFLRDRLCWSCV